MAGMVFFSVGGGLGRGLRRLLIAALCLVGGLADAAVGCYLTCLQDLPRCELTRSADPVPVQVPKAALLPVARCDTVTRLSGAVAGLVRFNGKSYDIRADDEKSLKAQLAPFKASTCLVTELACRAERDLALLSGRAGKPFDGAVQLGPVGQPCSMGFPCGLVRMPQAALSVQLDDAGFEGDVDVTAVRGKTGSLRVPVQQGRFEIPASLLAHGASYVYAAARTGRPVSAAGMFAVASENMMADALEDRREALAAGQAEPMASLKALLRNGFDWDAYVWIRDQGRKP